MSGLIERAARIGAARATVVIEAMIAAADLPRDVRVVREGDMLVLTGRGVGARSVSDPRFTRIGR